MINWSRKGKPVWGCTATGNPGYGHDHARSSLGSCPAAFPWDWCSASLLYYLAILLDGVCGSAPHPIPQRTGSLPEASGPTTDHLNRTGRGYDMISEARGRESAWLRLDCSAVR
jgi:hypothetical protein